MQPPQQPPGWGPPGQQPGWSTPGQPPNWGPQQHAQVSVPPPPPEDNRKKLLAVIGIGSMCVVCMAVSAILPKPPSTTPTSGANSHAGMPVPSAVGATPVAPSLDGAPSVHSAAPSAPTPAIAAPVPAMTATPTALGQARRSTTDGAPVTVSVSVQVDQQDGDGQQWDAGEAPDVALCVVSTSGTRCYPDGSRDGIPRRPQCQDAFLCAFPGVEFPSGSFSLRIVDVDIINNDIVGEGRCAIGARCRIGRATVQVGDETAFRAMTPAQHLAAARLAIGEGNKDAVEARRQLNAIPADAAEHSEAEELLASIAREEREQATAVAREERTARAAEERHRQERAVAAQVARESGGSEGRRMRQHAMRNVSASSGLRMRASGPNGTTVRIDALNCNREAVNRLLSGGSRSELRGAGFRRLECHGGTGVVSEDL